jgi:hypothetical protein
MWGLQSNQLRRIKWKGNILEQQSNQLRRIKIERDYPKLIATYLVKQLSIHVIWLIWCDPAMQYISRDR